MNEFKDRKSNAIETRTSVLFNNACGKRLFSLFFSLFHSILYRLIRGKDDTILILLDMSVETESVEGADRMNGSFLSYTLSYMSVEGVTKLLLNSFFSLSAF